MLSQIFQKTVQKFPFCPQFQHPKSAKKEGKGNRDESQRKASSHSAFCAVRFRIISGTAIALAPRGPPQPASACRPS